jgi:misacylated tRNA(Ala) deacylase
MTELIYHTDSYQQTFQAQVSDIDHENLGLVLSKTTFFPGGGGQPPDFGALRYGGEIYHVKRAKRIKGRIVHLLDEDAPLPETGDTVEGTIDWEHRYQLMRTHTAMHILCGVVYRDYGASVTGGKMEPLAGRMDFEFESMHKELVQAIEDAINEEVHNGLPVTWRELPREEAFQIPDLIRTKINLLPDHIQQVRVVEIKGLDLQADGGTHVKNTSEVGPIHTMDYKSKGAENKRIYVELE